MDTSKTATSGSVSTEQRLPCRDTGGIGRQEHRRGFARSAAEAATQTSIKRSQNEPLAYKGVVRNSSTHTTTDYRSVIPKTLGNYQPIFATAPTTTDWSSIPLRGLSGLPVTHVTPSSQPLPGRPLACSSPIYAPGPPPIFNPPTATKLIPAIESPSSFLTTPSWPSFGIPEYRYFPVPPSSPAIPPTSTNPLSALAAFATTPPPAHGPIGSFHCPTPLPTSAIAQACTSQRLAKLPTHLTLPADIVGEPIEIRHYRFPDPNFQLSLTDHFSILYFSAQASGTPQPRLFMYVS